MVIPISDSECNTLIVSLHSLSHQYKYGTYRRKQFPSIKDFFIEKDKFTVPQMVRAVRKEYKASWTEFFWRRDEYQRTLRDFDNYLVEKYSNKYPEICI